MNFIITSVLEIAAVTAIICGFVFEQKLVDFEDRLWLKIKVRRAQPRRKRLGRDMRTSGSERFRKNVSA